MKPPCTIVVQYILPSLRAEIARQLVERHGLSRSEVADRMDLTPAAVTQYLKKARGDAAAKIVDASERAKQLVSELSGDLARDETPGDILLLKLCRACVAVRREGLICDLHKEAMPSLRDIDVDECACSLGLLAENPKPTEKTPEK